MFHVSLNKNLIIILTKPYADFNRKKNVTFLKDKFIQIWIHFDLTKTHSDCHNSVPQYQYICL